MGDSVSLICTVCKSKYPKGKFSFLLIGRGIGITANLLPAYCTNCKKFASVSAENTQCKNCNTLLQLLGDFIIEKQINYINNNDNSFKFYLSWGLLKNKDLGLTEDRLISNSQLPKLERLLISINKNWKDNYYLVFRIGFKKFYNCPSCGSYSVKLYPAFAMWD